MRVQIHSVYNLNGERLVKLEQEPSADGWAGAPGPDRAWLPGGPVLISQGFKFESRAVRPFPRCCPRFPDTVLV
jgi:hypothetical protein